MWKSLLQTGARWIPPRVRRVVRLQREKLRLARLSRIPVDHEVARDESLTRERLASLFAGTAGIADEWADVARELAALGITDRADGVNPGDRRAVYYLVRALRPRTVLEIGTHIGASTAHIACALRGTPGADVISVDIADVNDVASRPWQRFGATMSPRELVTRLGMGDAVHFVTDRSIVYLARARARFDFIFLDGDHSASTVYQELPDALRLLNPGGVILMHDYFPDAVPLWPDGVVIPGSWLAVQRLRAEGARIDVLPLGDLPWPTKQGTRRTSLAVVVGA